MVMMRRFYSQLKLSNEFALMATSLLQRNPVVMKPLSSIEIEYAKYKANLEQEKSRGTFQIGTLSGSQGGASPLASTELVDPDVMIQLNENLDAKNLNRKLDRKLYFLIKDASTNQWTLPTVRFTVHDFNVEGLHAQAHKHLSDIFAPSKGLELYHVGPSPVAFYSEKYPDRVSVPLGAKYFFFRSQLVAGKVQVDPKYPDFGWFCKEEIESKLDTSLFEAIDPVLSE